MDIITPRTTTTTKDDDAIRTELLNIVETPVSEPAQVGADQTAVDPGAAPTVTHVYRVGSIVRVIRSSGPTPAQALKSVGAIVLDTSSITPNNQHRLLGAKHRLDPIHKDLVGVIGDILSMQEPDVPDDYRALAEAACASQPTNQTSEQIREWAERLGGTIAED